MTDITDAIAATSLVDEARESVGAGAVPASRIARAARGEADLGPVVPMGALPLYRALRARAALAVSPMARAAATTIDQHRVADGVVIRTIDEGDVVWLVLDLAEGMRPTTVELVGSTGRLARLPVEQAIDGVIQLGFGRATPADADIIALLEDPATAIFLV